MAQQWVKIKYRLNIFLIPANKSSKQDLKELNCFQVSKLCLRPKLKKIFKNRKKYEAHNKAKQCLACTQKLSGMHAKKQENMTYTGRKNQSSENNPGLTQTLELAE